ncbi:hypothetical protein [Siminovitchia acidinfaciens]|nr:hypothetical protein [Siminovitchia acidinfaciens]
MQTGVLIGMSIILGLVAVFLVYYIGTALDSSDSNTIDELPSESKK